MRYLLLAGAIACEVTATLCLRAALDAPLLYLPVTAGYLASFVLLALVLRGGMAVGVAYGIWGATGVAATALLSFIFFGEALTPVMLLGIALIVVGVLTVELGAGHGRREDAAP